MTNTEALFSTSLFGNSQIKEVTFTSQKQTRSKPRGFLQKPSLHDGGEEKKGIPNLPYFQTEITQKPATLASQTCLSLYVLIT